MKIRIEGAEAVVADLGQVSAKTNKAAVNAMNRAIASGRTVMVSAMAGDTGLKSGVIRDAIPLQDATLGRPQASFGASLVRLPLIDFKARQTAKGVTYVNPGAGGRKLMPHAFIAEMSNGHEGVFMRKGKARLPIEEKRGPSLGKVFAKFRSLGVARVQEMFQQRFKTELEFELSKTGTNG